MKAFVFRGKEKGGRIEEVPDPALRSGEVLIRVAACGICHTDLHYLDHGVPTGKEPPIVLGHEVTGFVDTLPQGHRGDLKTGDRVLVPSTWPCRLCPNCREGRETICERLVMPGNHADGGFAEYIAVPATECVVLPGSVDLLEASVVADALSTGFHAVRDRGRVRPGDRVVVFGCGGVGLSVVQCAVAAGASVWAVDKRASSLELARSFGATPIDAGGSASVEKEIRNATGGGADIAFEVIGLAATLHQGALSVRRGGRLVSVGYCPEDAPMPLWKVMFYELEIVGSLGCPRNAYAPLLAMIASGKLKIGPLVTNRYPLDGIERGFEALREGKGLRSIVVMDGACKELP
jgi:threonine dehydrogenase-like Zn-dependent dehydrogenase